MNDNREKTWLRVMSVAALILPVAILPSWIGDDPALPGVEASEASYPVVDGSFLTGLSWRFVGPVRGGRAPAVAGDPNDPLVFYFGTGHGGVWKTTNGGKHWRNVSDAFFKVAPVGAMDVSLSDPRVIYVGTGEGIPRQHVTAGDGVYKSTDAGETWTNVGLADTRHISRIRIHPTNPDVVYVAAMGDLFGRNPERGIYRTRDGGKSWQKILYKSEQTSGVDLTFDANSPNVIYASLNQYQRLPWDEMSGGPETGIFKSTDGGDTWTELTGNPGLPRRPIGKVGLSASPARSGRVYAIIEAAEGGVYRSDDAGATWQMMSNEREQRRFPASYSHITSDPQDADIVYVQNVAFWKSTDGGKSWTTPPMLHSDHHALWIDPKNNKRMIDGGDGGGSITMDGGLTWSSLNNQPTADLLSLAVDDQEPYWVYAAQNDNSHIGIPSRAPGGAIGWPSYLDIDQGEGGHTAVKPDGSVVYGADRTALVRWDRKSGQAPDISVWPEDEFGIAAKDVKYRFYYSFPVLLSPHDPGVLYTASQRLHRTTDEGNSWETISPDLTKNRLDVMANMAGRPITTLQSSLYYVSLIRTIAESPLQKGELWVGTDDSSVQLTRDGGKSWENVSPPDLPEWTTITAIDVSHHARGTAYLSGERHRVSDRTPFLYKTNDYGKSWERITRGIGENDHTYVIREDPVRPGLLYVGSERGAHVSFDDGSSWQPLQRNLPAVAVMHMLVKDDDLVIATHGRGFWIMDDLAALRQITPQVTAAHTHLFEIAPTVRTPGGRRSAAARARPGLQFTDAEGMSVAFEERVDLDGEVRRNFLDAGANPPSGVLVEYYFREAPSSEATLTILDAHGEVIQRFSSTAGSAQGMPARAGMNRFYWDMRYPNAAEFRGGPEMSSFEVSRPVPPLAPPGGYTARLTVDGASLEQPFVIRKNPQVSATDADLMAQFDLLIRIRDKVTEVNQGLTRLGNARHRLQQMGAETPAARQAAEEIEAKLLSIEGKLRRLTLSHPHHLGPKGLNDKLGTLSGKVARGDSRPNRQMVVVFDELTAQVDTQLRQLDEVIGRDLAALQSASGAGPR